MNTQPANIDPEDVLQRMAREVGTLTAEKHIAESQRDAALRQVAELTEQVVAGQTQINAVTAELTEANRERAAVKDERDALNERIRAVGSPCVSGCNLPGGHNGGCNLPGDDLD